MISVPCLLVVRSSKVSVIMKWPCTTMSSYPSYNTIGQNRVRRPVRIRQAQAQAALEHGNRWEIMKSQSNRPPLLLLLLSFRLLLMVNLEGPSLSLRRPPSASYIQCSQRTQTRTWARARRVPDSRASLSGGISTDSGYGRNLCECNVLLAPICPEERYQSLHQCAQGTESSCW